MAVEKGDRDHPAEYRITVEDQFALDFYSKLSAGGRSKSNIFFSPWSIEAAFSMVYEGAKGKTADEIRRVFYIPEDDKARRVSIRFIQGGLRKGTGDDGAVANYILTTANALWIQEGYKILDKFIDTSTRYYDSRVANLDFGSDDAIDTINDWVSKKTNSKVEQFLAPGSTNKDTQMVITNAVYFKGTWVKKFDRNWTYDEDFRESSQKTVKVPMMKMTEYLPYAETDQLQIIELRYKGDKLSMLIVLPKLDNVNDGFAALKSLEQSFTRENLKRWKDNLRSRKVIVEIPRFTLRTGYDLIPSLKRMGMVSPFDENADFSGITEQEQLVIGGAIHKAFVDVNEEGTEAAAATAVATPKSSAGRTLPPVHFRADHPFIFMIQDMDSGTILFMGRIVDPTKQNADS